MKDVTHWISYIKEEGRPLDVVVSRKLRGTITKEVMAELDAVRQILEAQAEFQAFALEYIAELQSTVIASEQAIAQLKKKVDRLETISLSAGITAAKAMRLSLNAWTH
ncbi:MAG: hypothetical protein KDA17_04110 [Candidatus Saccharibacteria bacterium]|nr:hypothetical protein [Candidatus Saccharibacteria bacterium]